jgi:hypothetical protein
MGLYLGEYKIVVNLNGAACTINIVSAHHPSDGVKLISIDNMIMKSSDGLYLIAKAGEQ